MTRRCEMCGAEITTKDRRRKYCDICRKTRKRFFDQAALDRFRQKAREQRAAEKQLLQDTLFENSRLKAEIIRQRQEIERLKARW